jgi:TetR/AcrR family transcriptional repressor of nem operon
MAILSTMVGAVLLSRAVNDERLSKRFVKAAAEGVQMGSSADDAQHGSRQ